MLLWVCTQAVGQMDSDANQKDPFYLPEKFVPIVKLFKKVSNG